MVARDLETDQQIAAFFPTENNSLILLPYNVSYPKQCHLSNKT